jgi:hypothetical protein
MDEFIQCDFTADGGRFHPFRPRDFSPFIQMHLAIDDATEYMQTTVRCNGNEIRTRRRIIISRQTNGTLVMDCRIVGYNSPPGIAHPADFLPIHLYARLGITDSALYDFGRTVTNRLISFSVDKPGLSHPPNIPLSPSRETERREGDRMASAGVSSAGF